MSQQYQKQKEKWFNAGKSQATKEILEEFNKNIGLFEEIRRCLTCSGCKKIIDKRVEELKQQLQKLGEGRS